MAEKNDGQREKPKEKSKQSLFTNLTDALDFSQVRSSQDAQLLEEAREATKTGGKMSREQVCSIDPTLIRYLDTCQSILSIAFSMYQYGALRRKIGGTYKDFFKSYVDGNLITVLYIFFGISICNLFVLMFVHLFDVFS